MKKLLIILLVASLVALSACTLSNREETSSGSAIAQDPPPDTIQFHQTEPEPSLDESEFSHEAVTESADAEVPGKSNPGLTDSRETTDVPVATEASSPQSQREPVVPTRPSASIQTEPTPEMSEKPGPETTSEQKTGSDPTPELTEEPIHEEKEESEQAFDVDYWVGFAISYGQQIGLAYDSGVTECWDNPIIASSKSIYLERDITSRLDRYLKRGMTAFGVWAQPRGDGAYDIYIAYA